MSAKDTDLNKPYTMTSLSEQAQFFKKETIKSNALDYFETGFPHLDDALGGGLCAGLYILGAMSNIGKSTFALQVAQNIATAGSPVLYFSLEMSAKNIFAKAISRETFLTSDQSPENAISASKLVSNKEVEKLLDNSNYWPRIEQSVQNAASFSENLFVIERGYSPISSDLISQKTRDFIKTGQYSQNPVVIVDYLQILMPDNNKDFRGDKTNVEKSISDLSALSVEMQIPVFVISSLNRSNYYEPINMVAFKETGMIEYSADVILGMQFHAVANNNNKKVDEIIINEEKKKCPRSVDIVILKQRFGESGTIIPMNYYSPFDYFEEDNENNPPFSHDENVIDAPDNQTKAGSAVEKQKPEKKETSSLNQDTPVHKRTMPDKKIPKERIRI